MGGKLAARQQHDPEMRAPHLIQGRYRFSEKIMPKQEAGPG
jgi:hypothetical protein